MTTTSFSAAGPAAVRRSRPLLNTYERRLLEILAANGEGLIVPALAHRAQLTRAETGHHVTRLVTRGLAARGRKTQPVRITELGLEAL